MRVLYAACAGLMLASCTTADYYAVNPLLGEIAENAAPPPAPVTVVYQETQAPVVVAQPVQVRTQAVPTPSQSGVYYANCTAARAAGAAPVYAGEAGYRGALDRDGDGVGCE